MVVSAESEHSVAFAAEQLAHFARGMTVIHEQRLNGRPFANRTYPSLPCDHAFIRVP
jgi:hypothetical protein